MNEREIFQGAIDHSDPAQRKAYLDQACSGDSALRARIEALLASHNAASQFLNVPAMDQLQAPAAHRQTVDFGRADEENADEGMGSSDGDDPENNPNAVPDLSFLQPSSQSGSIGTLGSYEILQVIGQGAFGIVFKAFDAKLQRTVAIKAMNPRLAATSPPRKRFLREARSVAAIKHENIVQVYTVEEEPLPYLVMEYIDGQTLQQKLNATGPLDVAEILHLGRQMALGLAAAHARGLIHRDIKPGNILLEQGAEPKVKITDFGLARAADDASMTRTGVIAGTPLFMAPEQAQGLPLDHRADLFSLGSVLYQMACGRPPFRAATAIAVLKRVTEETPRPIQEIISEVPDWLCAIISRLHAKNAEERFQSAKEVADLLGRCLSELQQYGRVESLADVLPMVLKPTTANAGQESSAMEAVSLTTRTTSVPEPRSRLNRRWVAAAAMIGILCVGLGMTEATGVTNLHGTVIRLFSPDGTLVVEVDDPEISVKIDGGEMIITGAGAKEIRLKPGEYKVLASKDGKVVRQEVVTVANNGRQVVRVSKEAEPVAIVPAVPRSASPLPPDFKNSFGMEFVLVPKGKSWLGGGGGKPGDKEVEFKEDFYLGKYEVTKEEWLKVIGGNPSGFPSLATNKGVPEADLKRFPVVSLKWDDCHEFVKLLNAKLNETGWEYRLPTSDQWEYACRGGPGSRLDGSFYFYVGTPSNELLPDQANFNMLLGRPCKVGSYPPNKLGLHDMHGNVLEWCADEVRDDGVGVQHVFRGGCYKNNSAGGRAGSFSPIKASYGDSAFGFRVARVRAAAKVESPPQAAVAPTPEIEAEPLALKPGEPAGQHVNSGQSSTDPWMRDTVTLSAERQVKAVIARLQELNPGFDGKMYYLIDQGAVVEVRFPTDEVTDISPLQAFQRLSILNLNSGYPNKGKLIDLTPLERLKLKELHLMGCSQIQDLTPLRGMPLKVFQLTSSSKLRDLNPLVGMPLTSLNLIGCRLLSDLSPLRGLKLKSLNLWQCSNVKDLTPLAGMPLERLELWGDTKVTDLSPLAGMPLEHLDLALCREVSDLTPLREMPLKFLSLGNCRKVSDLASLEGMPLESLLMDNCPLVHDLSPLRGMKLTKLHLDQCSEIRDLSPLTGLKLTNLTVDGTSVEDLTPLAGMPLEMLYFTPKNITKGIDAIRQMKSLKKIGLKFSFLKEEATVFPTEEFWKRYDMGAFSPNASSTGMEPTVNETDEMAVK